MTTRIGLTAGGVVGAGVLTLMLSAPAWAAGGYGPTTPTGASGAPGGYSSVLTTTTVPASGGNLSATLPGATLVLTVPDGSFSQPVELEVTQTTLSDVNNAMTGVGFPGYTAAAAIGIKVLDGNGTPIAGTFNKPITLQLRGPSLGVAGEKVLEFTGPSSVNVIPASLGAGTVTITLSADPDLAVVNPPARVAATAPSAATSVNTGLPFTGESDLAFGMLGGGALLMLLSFRHRRRTRAM